MLFHISETPAIARFEPRPSEYSPHPIVWAIDADRVRNYLLPRDCPRVTFYRGRQTTDADAMRFLGSSQAVVAIEERWVERVRACRLYCYRMPPDTFDCFDEGAGYFVSRVAVVPASVEILDDLFAELSRRKVDVRVVPNLWALRDAVVTSTLQFSIIRFRNAAPKGTISPDVFP